MSIDFYSNFNWDGSPLKSGFKIYFVSTLWYTNNPAINPESAEMWKEGWNETVWPCIMNNTSYITDSKSGVITSPESPDYPNKYPSKANCTWEIMVPDGTVLNLIFLSFDTEKKISYGCWDPLKIETRDFEDKYKEIGQFCGNKIPQDIILNETMKIHFTSDGNNEYSGFQIFFTFQNHLSSTDIEYLDGLKIMYQDSRMNLNSIGKLVTTTHTHKLHSTHFLVHRSHKSIRYSKMCFHH